MITPAVSAIGRSARTERVLTGLLGVLALAAGTLALIVGYGLLGTFRADRPLLDPLAVDWMRAHPSTTRIVALVAGLVLVAVGVLWLVRALRTEHHPDLRLDDELVVASAALCEAIRADAENVDGVSRARVRLVGEVAAPVLRLSLWLREGTDVRTVWQQLDERVLSRARESLELPSLPATVRLELDAGARQRVT